MLNKCFYNLAVKFKIKYNKKISIFKCIKAFVFFSKRKWLEIIIMLFCIVFRIYILF